MKRYITLLFFAAIAIVESASAQSLTVFGGLNFSGMKHKQNGATVESSMSTGYQIGLGAILPFKKSDDEDLTGIYPSLQYITKGLKKTTILGSIPSDVKLNYLQLNLPVYTQGGNYGIGFGPYAAISTSGKIKYSSITGGDRKANFGSDATADFKGLDYGLSLNMTLLLFYVQYDYGLANLSNGNFGKAKSRNFSFGLHIPLVQ